MKKFVFFLSLLAITNLNAKENLKFFISKAIKNNFQLNAERKNLESAKQEKIYQEANFYQVSLYLVVKQVLHLLIKQIKTDLILQTQVPIQKVKKFLSSRKFLQVLKVLTLLKNQS